MIYKKKKRPRGEVVQVPCNGLFIYVCMERERELKGGEREKEVLSP
jgi:hypothetical protein